MSDRLPVPWSQRATDRDILEAPPPTPRQPPIRVAYPATSWFWRNLARTRVLPPEEMVTWRESLQTVRPRERPLDRRLFWWWHLDQALPWLGGVMLLVALVWFLARVT